MVVSDAVKNKYKSNSVTKHLTLEFPNLGITVKGEQIHHESLYLKESLLEKKSIEFVGCIASKFKVKIKDFYTNIKGERIIAYIHTEDTENEPITLFNGIVDSALKTSNKEVKEIVAYDELNTKGNTDVAAWYQSLTFPITLKDFRDSLFERVGLTQVARSLPNDDITINKQYDPKTLKALNVIKAICQINGAFGIINRSGNFEYRILSSEIVSVPYPSTLLFPSTGLFPASPVIAMSVAERTSNEVEAETFSFYKKVSYEEFEVKPVDKVTIRQSENDSGVTYGSGANNYIIQGNMFTYGLDTGTLETIASRIYENVQGVMYHPFTSDNNGLPFVECGLDVVSYYMIDFNSNARSANNSSIKNFYVFNRELKGIQNLRDSYGANGEEYQTEFITDLQTQIDVIKQDVRKEVDNAIKEYDFSTEFGKYTYDKSNLDSKFDDLNSKFAEQWNHVLVDSVPTAVQPMTIYYVKGEVVVN